MQEAFVGQLGAAARLFGRGARLVARAESPFLDLAGARTGDWRLPGACGCRARRRSSWRRCPPRSARPRRIVPTRCSICVFKTTSTGGCAWAEPANGASPTRPCRRATRSTFVRLALFYAWHVAATTSSPRSCSSA